MNGALGPPALLLHVDHIEIVFFIDQKQGATNSAPAEIVRPVRNRRSGLQMKTQFSIAGFTIEKELSGNLTADPFFTHEIQRALFYDSRTAVFAAPKQHLGESHIVFCR